MTSTFEDAQRQHNRISWRVKVDNLAASPYPDDDIIKVPIRFGDMRAIKAALVRLDQAAADLRTVGDDYPGSSCHKWCHERADAAIAAGTRSAETRSKAPSEGCQSGPKGIAR